MDVSNWLEWLFFATLIKLAYNGILAYLNNKLWFNIAHILFQNYSALYTNTFYYPCNIKRNSDILWQLSLASERSGKMLHGGLATNDIFSFWKPSCCCCTISIIFLQSSCRHTFKDCFWLITTRKGQEDEKEGYGHKLLSSNLEILVYIHKDRKSCRPP